MSESTDLATVDEGATEIAETSPLGSTAAMLTMMRELALNPDIDASKFETIARVANEQQDRAIRQQYYAAKARAIRAMPIIRKDGRIVIAGKDGQPDRVQGHFDRWPDVQRAITPHLDANHLTLTHDVDAENGKVVVVPILQHDNGFVERGGRMELPLDTSGGKNNVQGAGSAQSYGLRYTTRAILGLKFEVGHDDGNLFALSDEPLNDQQQRRVDELETVWGQGEEAFEHWWASLMPQDKAWLVQSGRYAEVTGRQALPGVARIAAAADAAERQERTPDVSTPEGWTDQYEIDCRNAASLDELQRVQQKGTNAMTRLKDGGFTDLHSRAVKAGSDAFARLAPADEGQG